MAKLLVNALKIIDMVQLQNFITLFIVDDNIVIDLVKKEIQKVENEKQSESWIIEGFPRTKVQALSL